MKSRRAATLVLLSCVIVATAWPALAAFHLMKISEVFAGSVLHPNAQYVELQMHSANQNFVSGHSVIVYDANNVELGRSTFSASVAIGTNQSTILIATAEAAALFNLTPDLTITPLLRAHGGKVCFDTIDCVSWGDYTGPSSGVGTPFSASSGIALGRAIHRDLTIAGGGTTLESTDDTGDSANDFDMGIPSPRTNAGVNGTLPASTCGNTTVEGLESCDDGNGTDTDACRNDCTYGLFCGDTILSVGEECDDGNNINTDACKNDCTEPECGDTIVSVGEECDDGNNVNTDACKDDCSLPMCGDTILSVGEECDDGNNINTDACKNDCTEPECGDGVVTPPEACDDSNNVNIDTCKDDCSLPECGDGIVSQGEPCDDGNDIDDDGCSNTCALLNCGNSTMDPGEECDDGNDDSGDGCAASCLLEFCGDGMVNNSGAETCDDQNSVDTDACRNDCTAPICGDGITDTGEECDDDNLFDGDGCDSECRIEDEPEADAGTDAGPDLGTDAAVDAGTDAGADAGSAPGPRPKDSGCSCHVVGTQQAHDTRPSWTWLLLALLAATLLWRRRSTITRGGDGA